LADLCWVAITSHQDMVTVTIKIPDLEQIMQQKKFSEKGKRQKQLKWNNSTLTVPSALAVKSFVSVASWAKVVISAFP